MNNEIDKLRAENERLNRLTISLAHSVSDEQVDVMSLKAELAAEQELSLRISIALKAEIDKLRAENAPIDKLVEALQTIGNSNHRNIQNAPGVANEALDNFNQWLESKSK